MEMTFADDKQRPEDLDKKLKKKIYICERIFKAKSLK